MSLHSTVAVKHTKHLAAFLSALGVQHNASAIDRPQLKILCISPALGEIREDEKLRTAMKLLGFSLLLQ